MKKTLIILSVFFSCKAGDTSPKTNANFVIKTMAASWVTRDSGKRVIGWLLFQVSPRMKYDSVGKKYVVVADTLYGYQYTEPVLDTAGKPVTDSAGKPKQILKEYIVNKDSVMWLSPLNLDSITKVRGRF